MDFLAKFNPSVDFAERVVTFPCGERVSCTCDQPAAPTLCSVQQARKWIRKREANVFFGVLKASMEDDKIAEKTAGQRDVSATPFDPLLHEFDDIF